MARIRTIKPEFHAHEELSALPAETHLLAAALMNYADDEGYFNANPVLIKAGTNPLRRDTTPIDRQLAQLEEIGYIEIRGKGLKKYGFIKHFADHQRVSHPSPSKIKPRFEEFPNSSGEIPERLRPELKGIEGNREQGREGKVSPVSVAEKVRQRTGILTPHMFSLFTAVCAREMEIGVPPDSIPAAMADSWKEYRREAPNLSITPGAEKFFGEGMWKDRNSWAWKEGKTNGSRYLEELRNSLDVATTSSTPPSRIV